MISYIVTSDTLTLVVGNRVETVQKSSPLFAKLLAKIQNYLDYRANNPSDLPGLDLLAQQLLDFIDIETAVKTYTFGSVKISENGTAEYNNTPLPAVLAKRLLDCLKADVPFEHLVLFIERLQENPSKRATEELYTFLEHENLPITERGTFLAYKAVQGNYLDKFSGKYYNVPGSLLTMERNQVCDDADIGCSYGFHVGSLEYVRRFACNYGTPGGNRIVIVEVDPADVVSVPKDCSFQKVRTCKYYVKCEYTGPLPKAAAKADDPYQDLGTASSSPEEFLDDDDDSNVAIYTQEELDEAVAEAAAEAAAETRQNLIDKLNIDD